jgi:L-Ala-D/L-Glu epimerase
LAPLSKGVIFTVMQTTIDRVEVYAYNIPMKPFAISLGTLYEAKNILVKIFAGDGLTGWGEGSPFPFIVGETQATAIALAKDFAQLWLGQDALDIQGRMRQLHGYVPFNTTVKSAFDMALYDIAAQRAGLPLYRFLGGEKKVLPTDETISVDTPQAMAAVAVQLKGQGAPFIKVKLGRGNDAAADIERVRAIRAAIGSAIPLRLDANQGWSTANAIVVLNALAGDNIQFCEQPVAGHDFMALKAVHQAVAVPVMADEACFNNFHAQQLIAQQACRYINIKLSKSSGILEATAIAKTAAAAGMDCMLGGMIESKLALTANAHFACAHNNIVFYDLDYCFPHTYDPVVGGVTFENRYHIHLPDVPGIGASVEEGFLGKCDSVLIR